MAHPGTILLHLSGITAGSLLIPVIRARYAHSRAQEVEEPDEVERAPATPASTPPPPPSTSRPRPVYVDPPPQPQPTPRQLLAISSHLRSQLSSPRTKPFDALFTLRQLHMLNQPPILTLPASTETLHPEKWIWRLPATVALHAILRRLVFNPEDVKAREAFLPISITLAIHALRWDGLIWAAVLKSRGADTAIEWERLMARVRGQAGGLGMKEDVAVMTRVAERPRLAPGLEEEQLAQRELTGLAAHSEAWARAMVKRGGTSRGRRALRRRQAQRRDRARMNGASLAPAEVILDAIPSPPTPLPLPPSLHPLSSLPPQTLEILFIYLAQLPDRTEAVTSSALAIALALNTLNIPRSQRTFYHSFEIAHALGRVDLATRFWVQHLEAVQRERGKGRAGSSRLVDENLRRITTTLRRFEKHFSTSPERKVLSSTALLTRALDREWVRLKESAAGGVTVDNPPSPATGAAYSPFVELLDLVANIPFAPHPNDFDAGSERRKVASIHARVYMASRRVMRGILEELLGRSIYLAPLKVVLGSSFPSPAPSPKLSLPAFNILIGYALRHFHSAELALRLIEKLRQEGHDPSAVTHNLLLPIRAQSAKEVLNLVSRTATNNHSFPSLLNYLSSIDDFSFLDHIVFELLPELDHSSLPPLRDESSASSSSPSASGDDKIQHLLPLATPPPPGRSPQLYLALLSALARAGRTGLAERVFRSARWAAELSRLDETPGLGWVLPPPAFTIMLQLYATEVKRGMRAERQQGINRDAPLSVETNDEESKAFVKGWGRHALRVLLHKERQQALRAELGEDVDLRRKRGRRTLALEPMLRSRAGPVVALWELEGGSSTEELESLGKAMKGPRAREALEVLFPERVRRRSGQVTRRIEKRAKDARRERRMVRSLILRRRSRLSRL